MTITCIKCGHVNAQATGDPLECCPACGVIYAKARPSTARRPPSAQSPGLLRSAEAPAAPTSIHPGMADLSMARPGADRPLPIRHGSGYLELLRAESAYPTFRSVVTLGSLAGYAVGVLPLAIGLITGLVRRNSVSTYMLVVLLMWALIALVLTKLLREMSLMVADMSDAAVRTARTMEAVQSTRE